MDTQIFTAMGSRIHLIWESDSPPPPEWKQIPSCFEEWEQCLSRFRPDSELSRLNAQAGTFVRVSPTMAEVLSLAQQAEVWSEGLVRPTLLPQLEATGYTFDFKTMATQSDMVVIPAVIPPVKAGMIEVDVAQQKVRLPAGMKVDVGGIAKGWAAQRLAEQFGALSPVLIEVGGDIAVRGPRTDGSAWAIAVTNPLAPDDRTPLALVLLTGGGVATSGRDYRRWQVGERAYHHIIDPRTGEPAITDVLTATVIAPTTIEAEVAAKVVLIRGSAEGLAWIEQDPTLAALVVCENGDIQVSERWKLYDWTYLSTPR